MCINCSGKSRHLSWLPLNNTSSTGGVLWYHSRVSILTQTTLGIFPYSKHYTSIFKTYCFVFLFFKVQIFLYHCYNDRWPLPCYWWLSLIWSGPPVVKSQFHGQMNWSRLEGYETSVPIHVINTNSINSNTRD